MTRVYIPPPFPTRLRPVKCKSGAGCAACAEDDFRGQKPIPGMKKPAAVGGQPVRLFDGWKGGEIPFRRWRFTRHTGEGRYLGLQAHESGARDPDFRQDDELFTAA